MKDAKDAYARFTEKQTYGAILCPMCQRLPNGEAVFQEHWIDPQSDEGAATLGFAKENPPQPMPVKGCPHSVKGFDWTVKGGPPPPPWALPQKVCRDPIKVD